MVGADGRLPLPWLDAPLARALANRRTHALLLHGPQGVGQFELALTLAQAWLCEAREGRDADDDGGRPATRDEHNGVAASAAAGKPKPCGVCAACRLVQAHTHPDLRVLVPDALREATGWWEGDESASEKSGSKAKPSKEIKVDAVRGAVAFAQSTSARGGVKVVVLHPAERMNGISANTLLKTLEEPPGGARFILSCASPEALLPTVRSRCQAQRLELPQADVAADWLRGRGVADPLVLLAATGGQPQEVLAWAEEGIDAGLWSRLPALVRQGDASAFSGWPTARLIDTLQKLCHDAARASAGASPRYFPVPSLPKGARIEALTDWMRELNRCARHAEHPWNPGLLAESLVRQGQKALDTSTPSARGRSLHFAA